MRTAARVHDVRAGRARLACEAAAGCTTCRAGRGCALRWLSRPGEPLLEVPERRPDGGRLAPGEAGSDLQRTVDRLVKDLGSPIAAVQNEARRELLALGPFARSYLDALKVKHPETLGPLIEQLDRIDALRRVLPGKVEETIPRLAERLVQGVHRRVVHDHLRDALGVDGAGDRHARPSAGTF